MTQNKTNAPEHEEPKEDGDARWAEYRQRYAAEWSRRALQRAGVEAPTAEQMALFDHEAELLQEAMQRFAAAVPRADDDSPAIMAAALVDYYPRPFYETWLQREVEYMSRLQGDLADELGWKELDEADWRLCLKLNAEEQRRCTGEDDV